MSTLRRYGRGLKLNGQVLETDDAITSTQRMSIVDMIAANDPIASVAGNQSNGVRFISLRARSCTGVRFDWRGGATTIRCRLWMVDDGLSKANVDIAVSGAGVYTATFPSAFTLVANKAYIVTIYDTSGGAYTSVTALTGVWPSTPFVSSDVIFCGLRHFKSTSPQDAYPASQGGDSYSVEPILV